MVPCLLRYRVHKKKVEQARTLGIEWIEQIRGKDAGVIIAELYQEEEQEFLCFLLFQEEEIAKQFQRSKIFLEFQEKIKELSEKEPTWKELVLVHTSRPLPLEPVRPQFRFAPASPWPRENPPA